jgi:hypothetical protein
MLYITSKFVLYTNLKKGKNMKKVFFLMIILAGLFISCQKEDLVKLEGLTSVNLTLKSGLYDNIVEKGMQTLFQGTATNYSTNYPFLWVIDGDSINSDQLTLQTSFEETGQKEISLTVYDELGNPTTANISIVVVEEYPYPREFKYSANLMANGQWLYGIWVNLDYVEGAPENYYWFEKDQNDNWMVTEIINFFVDQNGVTWGKFNIASYNTTKVWSYGKIINDVIYHANLNGSNHYDPDEEALHSALYNGNIANFPFDFPEIPGTGDEVYKVSKWDEQITIYFNFKDYSSFQINPMCEIKVSSGTQRTAMSHFNGTGWATIVLYEDDLVDNLAIFRFGNVDLDQFFHLAYNDQASGWNPEEGFIILKILDL